MPQKRWLVGILVVSAFVALGSAALSAWSDRRSPPAEAVCAGPLLLDFTCHRDHLRRLVLEVDVDTAFAVLKENSEMNGVVRAGCHQLTHAIGRAAADLTRDVASAYALGDSFCSFGYYHGVVEGLVAEMGAEQVLADPDALCTDLGRLPPGTIDHRNCLHGLGHGFMAIFTNDVIQALVACDALTEARARESCYGGVFMENVMANVADPNQATPYLRPDQPLYPCSEIDNRYKDICYQKQAPYALFRYDADFAKTFALCGSVNDGFRSSCYKGLGSAAAVHTVKYVIGDRAILESIEQLCLLGADRDARANCVRGATRSLINYFDTDTKAKALCDMVNADLRLVCLVTIKEKRDWPE
jgi:hypothetical protein